MPVRVVECIRKQLVLVLSIPAVNRNLSGLNLGAGVCGDDDDGDANGDDVADGGGGDAASGVVAHYIV